ncbi:MAG: hypothetical protein KAG43_05155, partial [Candidatus Marithrix sp.]|nr:hypothetical protein [Candidatus Marithrix sp.]
GFAHDMPRSHTNSPVGKVILVHKIGMLTDRTNIIGALFFGVLLTVYLCKLLRLMLIYFNYNI